MGCVQSTATYNTLAAFGAHLSAIAHEILAAQPSAGAAGAASRARDWVLGEMAARAQEILGDFATGDLQAACGWPPTIYGSQGEHSWAAEPPNSAVWRAEPAAPVGWCSTALSLDIGEVMTVQSLVTVLVVEMREQGFLPGAAPARAPQQGAANANDARGSGDPARAAAACFYSAVVAAFVNNAALAEIARKIDSLLQRQEKHNHSARAPRSGAQTLVRAGQRPEQILARQPLFTGAIPSGYSLRWPEKQQHHHHH
jgi:hypothetical protein